MKLTPPRILCATDFSNQAAQAASAAAGLAMRSEATVILVHAVHVTGPAVLAEARKRLDVEVMRLRAMGANVEPVLLRQFPAADALLDYIRAHSPALVVVSSGAKGFVDRWAFGSVSEEVAQSSPVPTLVVRDPQPFTTWDRLRVLVAVDRSSSSDAVLHWVKQLLRVGPCDLVTCYVKWQPVTGTARIPEAGAPQPVDPPRAQNRFERDLRKKVRDVLGDEAGEIIVRPTSGTPESALVEIARDTRAHLIVIGSHQRRGLSLMFHGSVSRALLQRAGMNILCVPTAIEIDPREAHIPEYRRVLVATDFSALGNAAVPYACAACAVGGLIRIVHVTPPPRPGSASAARLKKAELHEQLRNLIPAELGARAQVPEVAVIEHRETAQAICHEADRFGADLVCIASHGLSGSKAVFGSVTAAVLKSIRRPFLVVRRPDE